jgi:hypothetical protein
VSSGDGSFTLGIGFYCHGPDSKYFGLVSYIFSVTTTQLCHEGPEAVVVNMECVNE